MTRILRVGVNHGGSADLIADKVELRDQSSGLKAVAQLAA